MFCLEFQKMFADKIFKIKSISEFKNLALRIFKLQADINPVYNSYLKQLKTIPSKVNSIKEIPFLPIEFFKTKALSNNCEEDGRGNPKKSKKIISKSGSMLFTSSGTSGSPSHHFVYDLNLYEKSFLNSFELFYGNIENYSLLALLPSYLENKNSSLIYMTDNLIKKTKNKNSGFFLYDFVLLSKKLFELEKEKQKTILLGVSYALLDFSEKTKSPVSGGNWLTVMETGGMKGRRPELIREDLHKRLQKYFGVKKIHSEYGMTELLSQAYSKGKGVFNCPPWMKILIRDTNDPFQILGPGKTGGINIIDLANINSCSFIATQDLGQLHPDGSFEVLGRYDGSELRGCNLMVD